MDLSPGWKVTYDDALDTAPKTQEPIELEIPKEETKMATSLLIAALQDTAKQIGDLRSSINAINYQISSMRNELNDIKNEIQNMTTSTGILSGTAGMISVESSKLHNSFNEIYKLACSMRTTIDTFNSIAEDPIVTNTIEDIKAISGRFDSIMED